MLPSGDHMKLVNPLFLTIRVSIVIGNHAADLQRGENLNNKLSSDVFNTTDVHVTLMMCCLIILKSVTGIWMGC